MNREEFWEEFNRAKKRPKLKKSSDTSPVCDLFAFHVKHHLKIPFVREHKFAVGIGRGWRFDFAFLDEKVAVEVEGLVVRRINGDLYCLGRHASITGFRGDCEKYAWAAILGWSVLRFEREQIKAGLAIDLTRKALASKRAAITVQPT